MYLELDEDDLPALDHTPIRPPRSGFPREHVFAGRWQKLMQTRKSALNKVLRDYKAPVGQREAAVAASIVTWLGTNMGQALLEMAAKDLSAKRVGEWASGYAASVAHLKTWATQNRRMFGINNGVRYLEAILSAPDASGYSKPSAEDYEVAEHVMFWLGQYEGHAFLVQCQAEVKALAHIESYASLCRMGQVDLDYTTKIREELPACAATGEIAAAALDAVEAEFGPLASRQEA